MLCAAAGVEFIDENGGGPGVRLRKRQQREKHKKPPVLQHSVIFESNGSQSD